MMKETEIQNPSKTKTQNPSETSEREVQNLSAQDKARKHRKQQKQPFLLS